VKWALPGVKTKLPVLPPSEQPPVSGVSLRAIRKLAREITERFQPEKIILFGSYAHGTADANSDVDLLVIMPVRNMIDQAVRIRRATEHRFPLDIIVRSPAYVKRRLKDGDWFLREIVSQGKVLYESTDKGAGAESGSRLAERE
jgi:predicted nucleotidyltransferase